MESVKGKREEDMLKGRMLAMPQECGVQDNRYSEVEKC